MSIQQTDRLPMPRPLADESDEEDPSHEQESEEEFEPTIVRGLE
jgi:hypothetical protein